MGRTAALVALFAVGLFACSDDRRPSGVDGSVVRVDGSAVRDGGTRDGAPRTDGGAFGYCTGFTASTDDCRADSDCACGNCMVGGICAGGCAAQCGSDADCDGGICSGGCCPYCVPRCPETVCAEGSRCNTTTGRCDPIPCSEGMPCPTNTRCTPDAAGTGCVRLGCTTDADCDCGTCAEGQCYERPGLCCPPLPG